MVVGKVSEFIGSLYYLCVTLLRFKNIMKPEKLSFTFRSSSGGRSEGHKCHPAINIPNVNFVERGYKLSTGSFVAFPQRG